LTKEWGVRNIDLPFFFLWTDPTPDSDGDHLTRNRHYLLVDFINTRANIYI